MKDTNAPYDPVECLRAEVKRFKETNVFTPMLVTGFYLHAAVVLDQLEEAKQEIAILKSKLGRKATCHLCGDEVEINHIYCAHCF
jgi:hypothetical protein